MKTEVINFNGKTATGYVLPLGKINLVFAKTETGLLGCGAFDVMALDKFAYPAARVKSSSGGSIATVVDLLDGIVKDVNESASNLGVTVGMSGRQALEKL
jgi:uncharacterized protein YunC (DUF1805 family)